MSDVTLKQRIKDILGLRYNLLPSGQRFGRKRYEFYKWLLTTQHWSSDRIREFQWNRLIALLKHAYDNTEFYRERFKSIGAEPGDFRDFSDFRKFPCLTKEDVRQNLEKLKCREFDRHRPFQIRTGGSSGAPVRLFKSRDAEYMRKANVWRSIAWGGVDFREMHISIDNTFSFDGVEYPWWVDHRTRTILIKTFRMDEELLERYIVLHRRYQPTYYFGSVSFYRLLGMYMETHGIDDIRPRAIFLVGETIMPRDRDNIRKWFGCDLYDFYGLRENAVSAAECEKFNLHINAEYTYAEFEQNGEAAAPGQLAEIVGTNLYNYATPVIRYQTEDMGCWVDSECSCGRKHPLMRIEGGRSRDYLTTPTGKVFVTWHMIHLIDEKIGIKALQLYQPDIRNVKVRIVKRDSFTDEDERKIVDTLKKITQNELTFTVEYVESIPRTELGKFLFVKSELQE